MTSRVHRPLLRFRHTPAHIVLRRFSSLLRDAGVSPINECIDEENLPGGRIGGFYPAEPGEILDGRFKTITKLGYGAGSTVWLAENIRHTRSRKSPLPRYVSIKISALDIATGRETAVLKHINNVKSSPSGSDNGLNFIHTLVDEFKLPGLQGTHTCLVHAPMRETLHQVQKRMPRQRIPPPLFKLYAYLLLDALDFLHSACGIIHTDIKDTNIMVTFEKDAVLSDFAQYHKTHPQPRHVRPDGHVVYASQGDFGPLRGSTLLPKLADFNLAVPRRTDHISPIQPHCFRAPEVLLGCPWTYKVDIWNLGVMMWNLLENTDLFPRPVGEDGEYDAHVHLAQMASLLGDLPDELIEREQLSRYGPLLTPTIRNARSQECSTMNARFVAAGQILRKDLVGGATLADTVTEFSGNEKEEFLDFASCMLQWLPEKRQTARELMQLPIFDAVNQAREEWEKDL